VSRIPRFQEHLKTAFTAEAASAARYRANAAQAAEGGLPNLAKRWLRLAEAKDRLAIELLAAIDPLHTPDADLGNAISEEKYENDVLYPRMIRDVNQEVADVFLKVISTQKEHLRQLETLRQEANAARGDVQLPPEVDRGTAPSAPES
jgi:rubrerythrin